MRAFPVTNTYTLDNPTPQAGVQFGYSVALTDSKAIIGAIFDDVARTNAGAA
ncbi:MAG: hypothetical protein ACJA1F_002714 [Paracoccaceae bacterium]